MKTLRGTKAVSTRLSDRIRTARHAAKLSQAELASRVGVTPGAVAQWEGPQGTKPGIERLETIAMATGVIFDWLATGRGHIVIAYLSATYPALCQDNRIPGTVGAD